MKRFLVLTYLIGMICSNTLVNQCDTDKCDSNVVQSDGSIIFKSKQNGTKVANITSIKNVHYMPGNIMMDTNEEAGKYDHFVIVK